MKCEVCGKEEAVGVASSGLGLPLSVAYGPECLDREAESIQDIKIAIEMSGELSEEDQKFVDSIVTFHNGEYTTYGEVRKEESE